MPSASFEPAIPPNKQLQSYALDLAATGIGTCVYRNDVIRTISVPMGTDKPCKYINSLMELIVIYSHISFVTEIPLNAMLENTPLKNINPHYYTQTINYMIGKWITDEDQPSLHTMHCVLAILEQCNTFN